MGLKKSRKKKRSAAAVFDIKKGIMKPRCSVESKIRHMIRLNFEIYFLIDLFGEKRNNETKIANRSQETEKKIF